MFKVGDQVRITIPVFQEVIGTVVDIVPGRSAIISREFVVDTAGEFHRFFEEQLTLQPKGRALE